MIDVLDLADNVSLQMLSYGIAVLGLALAFRIVRYPDLTADGSFVLGATVYATTAIASGNWLLALAAGAAVGALAGALSGVLHARFSVSRLLTGILTSMIAYSLAFRILGGIPNIGLAGASSPFAAAQAWDAQAAADTGIHPLLILLSTAFATGVAALVYFFLGSEFGLVLRATGANPVLSRQFGRLVNAHQIAGLAVANALVAVSAGLIAARQGFADVNMGLGTLINLVAALAIGEEVVRRLSRNFAETRAGRIVASFLGAGLYFAMYLFILRASIRGWIPFSIQPTDLKLLSALVVIAVIALRRSRPATEEVLPL